MAEIEVNRRKNIKLISVDLPDRFIATYKGYRISISTMQKNGENVFCIEVTDSRGCYAVDTWERFETIDEAIDYALNGACI